MKDGRVVPNMPKKTKIEAVVEAVVEVVQLARKGRKNAQEALKAAHEAYESTNACYDDPYEAKLSNDYNSKKAALDAAERIFNDVLAAYQVFDSVRGAPVFAEVIPANSKSN